MRVLNFFIVYFINIINTSPFTLYVSVNDGDDMAIGAGLTINQPFATIQKAKDYIRDNKDLINDNIEVVIKSGIYRLNETLLFTVEDSGSTNFSITYRPYCNASRLINDTVITPYPYPSTTSIKTTPLRYMWNGVGNYTAWKNISDPFKALGADDIITGTTWGTVTDTAMLSTAPTICVDRVNIGNVCYYEAMGNCVAECSDACTKNIRKKVYDSQFYRDFEELFGKDLTKEEDCIELCLPYCHGCDDVVVTGFQVISTSNWTLLSTNDTVNLYCADINGTYPINELYMNGEQLDLARVPNKNGSLQSVIEGTIINASAIGYNTTENSFNWTDVDDLRIRVFLKEISGKSLGSLIYQVDNFDNFTGIVILGYGGSQISKSLFVNGLTNTSDLLISSSVDLIFEGVRDELDALGEWFYNSTQQTLCLCNDQDLSFINSSLFETPSFPQLIKIGNVTENGFVESSSAPVVVLHDIFIPPKLMNITFLNLQFTGSQESFFDTYEILPGINYTVTRSGAVYVENAANISFRGCTFRNIGGNALVISGENEDITVENVNFRLIGAYPFLLIPKFIYRILPDNSMRSLPLGHSIRTNIRYNRFREYGLYTSHVSAILVASSTETSATGNLVYRCLAESVDYVTTRAQDETETTTEIPLLLKPPVISLLDDLQMAELNTPYQITLQVFSSSELFLQIIGSTSCLSNTSYSNSTCETSVNNISIRKLNDITWFDYSVPIEMSYGDSVELNLTSAETYRTSNRVYIGFYHMTRNQRFSLLDVAWRTAWSVTTRGCNYTETTYPVGCGGPCGCGDSSLDIQSRQPNCNLGDDVLDGSLSCEGPFEIWTNCGTNIYRSELYYNCNLTCVTTTCL